MLVSKHVGVSRTIEAERAGRVMPVDEAAIAAELSALLSDPALRSEMGQNGYRSARKCYDIRAVAELMAVAYEDVLTGRRSPQLYWSSGNGS